MGWNVTVSNWIIFIHCQFNLFYYYRLWYWYRHIDDVQSWAHVALNTKWRCCQLLLPISCGICSKNYNNNNSSHSSVLLTRQLTSYGPWRLFRMLFRWLSLRLRFFCNIVSLTRSFVPQLSEEKKNYFI